MTEIKSTLDIVLERTKNLTLTDQERASLQRKELEGRVRGWVKKYLDGLMAIEALKAEMEAVPKEQRKASRDIFRSLIRENLDAQGDAVKILDLLECILEESRDPYLAAMQHYQRNLTAEQLRLIDSMKEGLAGLGISGSAVAPNLDRDGSWKRFRENALAEFRRGLSIIGRDS